MMEHHDVLLLVFFSPIALLSILIVICSIVAPIGMALVWFFDRKGAKP